MPKEGLTEIVCVLDRSGSMDKVQEEALVSFNNFLKEQREAPGEATITVVTFDDDYEVIRDGVPIKDCQDVTDKEYFARNMTAMNDAIAQGINTVGDRLNKTDEGDRPEKVIFVILTDGQENASKEFPNAKGGVEKIKEMIEHQREKYQWEFIYLAANVDAFSTGRGYGLASNMMANVSSTKKGLVASYAAGGQRVRAMRAYKGTDYSSLPDLEDEVDRKE